MKLSEQDAHALDWLMNRIHSSDPSATPGSADDDSGEFSRRVERTQSVLELIGMLPAEEPPIDLVARTLRRVRETASGPLPTAEAQTDLQTQPPVRPS